MERAEFYIREHQDNIVIAKLKTNKPLTENDIDSLEEILWKEIGTKQDYENEIGQKPLGEFVREIVGLDMNAAKEAFSAYLSASFFKLVPVTLTANSVFSLYKILECTKS